MSAARLAAFAALVLPLCLDTLVVCAALGAGRGSARGAWRVSLLFAVFEAGMPLLGLLAGSGLARATGGAADYLAAAVVAVAGLVTLLHDGDESSAIARALERGGGGLVLLALAVSLDELAVGAALGLLRLDVVVVVAVIAVQAVAAGRLGLWLGARLRARMREAGERLAGLLLLGVAALLVVERLSGGG